MAVHWRLSVTRRSIFRSIFCVRFAALSALTVGSVTQVWSSSSRAAHLSFRSYGKAENLTEVAGGCLLQDHAGFIWVCTENGVFVFGGRQFVNLGIRQGLPDGGTIYDIAMNGDGRIALRYADGLMMSEPATAERTPLDLVFHRVTNPFHTPLFNDQVHQLAVWRGGFAVSTGNAVMRVVGIPGGASSSLAPLNADPGEKRLLSAPLSLFGVDGHLWETFGDGRLCQADPGAVRCYQQPPRFSTGAWRYVAAGDDGTIVARSLTSFATLDPRTGGFVEEKLPFQDTEYENNTTFLGIFRTPAGEFLTNAADGVAIRKQNGWQNLTREDGIPAGSLRTALSDNEGHLWLKMFTSGLFLAQGYDQWQSLQPSDGLLNAMVWGTVRARDGSLWATTDGGLNKIVVGPDRTRAVTALSGPSYALAVAPDGNVWASSGSVGIRVIDPVTKLFSSVALPAVNSIAFTSNGAAFLGSEGGLFSIDPAHPSQSALRFDGTDRSRIISVLPDRSGGIWLLSRGRLWHRHSDGSRSLVDGAWPAQGFEPMVMADGGADHFWVGGGGGLIDLVLSGDHVIKYRLIGPPDIPLNSVYALVHDHRGWTWVGTDGGVSVFNGKRWITVDADDGLVSNNVSQGGITEDTDGSMWIATDAGLSHLRDPSSLFDTKPIKIAIEQARLGDVVLPAGRRLPFTAAPLDLRFGTFSFAAERAIVFRYRLSGVDAGWAETATGSVRYPFVPSGHHVLTVIGYNNLTHIASQPITLVIDIAAPLWRQWWALCLYAAAAAALFTAILRWRVHAAGLRERELERIVATRTIDMRAAQAELQRLATHDGLTGLLNRTELQRRLAEHLSSGRAATDLVAALIDLDHFKQINDRHGHLGGDSVLRAVGVRVAAILRDRDYAGRYGGEEILVILDDADGRGAVRVLGLHQSIRQAPFHCGDAPVDVTCSIGVAWAGPGDDWESLIGRADAALYEAKAAGRDRVVESRDDHALNPLAWPTAERLRRTGHAD